MAKPSKDQLAELRQKEAEIRARIQALEARDKEADRKKDARRKILIGGAVFAKVKRGEWTQKQLIDLLSSELKADRDRALFDLKPLPGSSSKGSAGEAAD
ncbi:TPA: mobilization protein [Escherichia coli]|nr:mobilization protein [Escherichia coli]